MKLWPDPKWVSHAILASVELDILRPAVRAPDVIAQLHHCLLSALAKSAGTFGHSSLNLACLTLVRDNFAFLVLNLNHDRCCLTSARTKLEAYLLDHFTFRLLLQPPRLALIFAHAFYVKVVNSQF